MVVPSPRCPWHLTTQTDELLYLVVQAPCEDDADEVGDEEGGGNVPRRQVVLSRPPLGRSLGLDPLDREEDEDQGGQPQETQTEGLADEDLWGGVGVGSGVAAGGPGDDR